MSDEEGPAADSRLTLSVLPSTLAVCRLDPGAPGPPWAEGEGFCSITRTGDEISVVCAEDRVPEGVRAERGWRALVVEGPLDFAMTGVLASLANPLAEAGISIFAVSTYETDYVLVKSDDLAEAVDVLGGYFDIRS